MGTAIIMDEMGNHFKNFLYMIKECERGEMVFVYLQRERNPKKKVTSLHGE